MSLCHLIIFSSGGGGAHCCCDSSGKSGGGGEVEPRQFQSERAGGEDDAVAAYTDTWSISIHTVFLLRRWRSKSTTNSRHVVVIKSIKFDGTMPVSSNAVSHGVGI